MLFLYSCLLGDHDVDGLSTCFLGFSRDRPILIPSMETKIGTNLQDVDLLLLLVQLYRNSACSGEIRETEKLHELHHVVLDLDLHLGPKYSHCHVYA